jgi:hypothetical protein
LGHVQQESRAPLDEAISALCNEIYVILAEYDLVGDGAEPSPLHKKLANAIRNLKRTLASAPREETAAPPKENKMFGNDPHGDPRDVYRGPKTYEFGEGAVSTTREAATATARQLSGKMFRDTGYGIDEPGINYLAEQIEKLLTSREQRYKEALRELLEIVQEHWQCAPDNECDECDIIRPIKVKAEQLLREQ